MNKILQGDALTMLKTLPDESVDMCMTSPPYWALRDYGCEGQLGLEKTPDEYVNRLCDIFDEVKRVLKPNGTCWVNIGDTYNSHSTGKGKVGGIEGKRKNKQDNTALNHKKPNLPDKCLCQIPSRFAIEMTNRGWVLRNEIIWYKPACMPSSVKDRFTIDFEKIFFFSKNGDYYFDTQYEPLAEATRTRLKYGWRSAKGSKLDKKIIGMTPESFNKATIKMLEVGKRIKRCVWKIAYTQFRGAHFATYPEALIEIPLKAGCPKEGIVLDPFFGAGTTGLVALKQNKHYLGIELNPEYIEIAEKRLKQWKNEFFG